MRCPLILLLCSCLYLSSFSQEYLPLLDENKRWYIAYYNGEGCPPNPISSFICDIYEVAFVADDTVDNVNYSLYSGSYLFGGDALLREDTIAQQVFWRENGIEKLLYDFNIEVGDTVQVRCQYSYFCEKILSSLDTIVTEDGVARRRYVFSDSFGTEWVEGIGSVGFGLLYQDYGIGVGTILSCYNEDGEELLGEYCDLVSLAEPKVGRVSFFPNPMTTSAILDIGEMKGPATLEIYDLSGKLIRSEFLTLDSGILTLQRGELASGSYLLRLIAERESVELPFVAE